MGSGNEEKFTYRNQELGVVEVEIIFSTNSGSSNGDAIGIRFKEGESRYGVAVETDAFVSGYIGFRDQISDLAKWMIHIGIHRVDKTPDGTYVKWKLAKHPNTDATFTYEIRPQSQLFQIVNPKLDRLVVHEHQLARRVILKLMYSFRTIRYEAVERGAQFPLDVIEQEYSALRSAGYIEMFRNTAGAGIGGENCLTLKGRQEYEDGQRAISNQAFIIAACDAPPAQKSKSGPHKKAIDAYKSVSREMGLEPIFQEHEEPRKNIFVDIFNYIDTCEFVIADLTFERPNCYIEVGYALARAKPVLIFIENEYFEINMEKKLPFDISPVKMQNYEYSKLEDLEKILRERIEKVRSR